MPKKPLRRHNREFLGTILANPFDVAPRLIYADWLDEQGDEEQAAFIRSDVPAPSERNRYREYRKQLGRRLAMLDPLKVRPHESSGQLTLVSTMTGMDTRYVFAGVRFGFVETLTISPSRLHDRAKFYFANNPIFEVHLAYWSPQAFVRFADYAPYACYSWNSNQIPPMLWNHLHPTAGTDRRLGFDYKLYNELWEAYRALSLACVNWGRSLAHLPPIEYPPVSPGDTQPDESPTV